MKALARVIKSTLERLAGLFYEGPEPPARIRDGVLLFRLAHPTATLGEWIEFAAQYAADSYRAGFERGFEWRERGLMEQAPSDPDVVADAIANGWTVADGNPQLREALDAGEDPNDPLHGVPPEARADFVDQLGVMYGTHRVVIVTDDTPPDGCRD